MSCDKCSELHKQLDTRNENTKVWIQADTQTRAYACQLEKELEDLKGKHRQLERRHEDMLCALKIKEQMFVSGLEATLRDTLDEVVGATYIESPFWATNDDGASWHKVPCTGVNKLDAYKTLLSYMSKYAAVVPADQMASFGKRHALEMLQLKTTIKTHESKLHSQWITCYHCGKALKEIKHMAEFKLLPWLDCTRCRRNDARETTQEASVAAGTTGDRLQQAVPPTVQAPKV